MWDRVAIFGVPIVAGLVTAAVLLGPGQERAVLGARVRGVLVRSTQRYALRVQTLRHAGGRYQPVSLPALELEMVHPDQGPTRWTGRSGDGGTAEAMGSIERPLRGQIHLQVRWGEQLLAEGEVLTRDELEAGPPTEPLDGRQQGSLQVSVRLPRGQAVPPFPEPLEITVLDPSTATEQDREPQPRHAARALSLQVQATGATVAEVGAPERQRCGDDGCPTLWRTTVSAEAPTAEITITATTAGAERGSWQGALPVTIGRLWLAPNGLQQGSLHVRSAVVRQRAYVSLLTPGGRAWGAMVPLSADGRGFATGRLALPRIPEGPVLAVLSGDPAESAGATIGWPLRPDEGSLPLEPLPVLLDGMPRVVAAERDRERSARRPAWGLILAAALFEVLYLFRRNRLAQAKLERDLGRPEPEDADGHGPSPSPHSLGGGPGSPTLLWLTILAALVLLAFVALAGLTAWA